MDTTSFDAEQEPQGVRPERDLTPASQGMSVHDLEQLLADIELQPQWRHEADKASSYYDAKQLSPERLEQLAESQEPATIVNLIFGAINGALGQEAKTRLDWMASADTDAYQDVVDVLNQKLQTAKRETKADMAVSEAYKGQIVPGIGWVEVGRESDPLRFPYKVKARHRNEVWWDWRAKECDYDDARWQLVSNWVDLDLAINAMPQYADTLRIGTTSGPITDSMMRTITYSHDKFESIGTTRRIFNRFEEEWLDNSARRRIRFYDVFYKQPRTVIALVAGDKRVEFNPANVLHQELVRRGQAMLVRGPSYQMRHARFAGPFRLFDKARKSRRFPLTPFVGFTDDEYGTPYGMVANMISPQDEYNERRSRLRWLLKAAQVFIDDDALNENFNNFKDVAREIMRPDSVFVLKAGRRNAQGIRVEHNMQLAREQVDVMQDAKQLVQEVPRIYSSMLGDAPTGVTSGLAINSLVEQGMIALGETNDNYRGSRGAVGDALSELILEDLSKPDLQVTLGKGKSARVVVLNTMSQDGLPQNSVEDAPLTIGLGDVPSTPAHKLQQQQHLAQLLQSVGNDPIARSVLMPDLIESTDLPNREEKARWMREKYGMPDPGQSQDPQQQQAEQQQKAQAAQLQQRAADAELAIKEAQAKSAASVATLNTVKAAQVVQAINAGPPDPTPGVAANEDDMVAQAIARAG
jgi:hypothetical protein